VGAGGHSSKEYHILRIGLVGLGKIAMVHAANIAANPRLRLSAVYDPFSPGREAFAKTSNARLASSLE
jgi:myo-inositol 2-dehydrogenase/D-chiro-inositol 1-dehydrogenase